MELLKRFNNKPNDHVTYGFNSEQIGIKIKHNFFVSRSCAVVGIVFAITGEGTVNVLIAKRSNKMLDEPNKVGIPCGYLDWNETLYEAMMREVYEETSLYLPDYEKYLLFNNNKQPFLVKDDPKRDKRQNISHLYVNVYDFRDHQDKFPVDVEEFSCKETTWVKWIKYVDFLNTIEDYKWAFNHDETIKTALQFFNKNFNG